MTLQWPNRSTARPLPSPFQRHASAGHALARALAFRRGEPTHALPHVHDVLQHDQSMPLGPELGWPTSFEDRFILGPVLGHGAYAAVYSGHDCESGRTVAVKVRFWQVPYY